MRRPGDEIAEMRGIGGAGRSAGSALATLRGLGGYRGASDGLYEAGGVTTRRLSEALEELELDLRANANPSTRGVAEGIRGAIGRVNGSCPSASRDLQGLLSDVTSPSLHLTLDDVVGRVQSIRGRLVR